MPSFDIEFEVYCAWCGGHLCNQTETKKGKREQWQAHVEPCEKCLDKAKDEGRQEAQS